MSDQHTYLIELRGAVDVNEVNARAPLKIVPLRTDSTTTLLSATTDQAGLIGLLRQWHGLGYQFLSMTCDSHDQENGHVEIQTDSSG